MVLFWNTGRTQILPRKSGLGHCLLLQGFLGVGALIDLFTLGGQVDTYNLMQQGRFNVNNIIVNVPQNHPAKPSDVSEQLLKLSELKDKGVLSDEEFANQKSKILS